MFDAQGTQHVVYAGVDKHVHELWWNTSGWHHNDLSAATAAPVVAGLRPGRFAAQRTQHVIHVGTGAHIYELWWG